jgi:hypothetical protein
MERLQELILYIARKMERDQHVGRGRIKLAKLLWRCDFAAYWRFGEPITETRYHADKLGPSPTGEMLALRDLQTAGRLDIVNEWDRQEIPYAKGEPPRLGLFTAEQIALVDDQLEQYRYITGNAMVAEAHLFPGWIHAWEQRTKHETKPLVPFESVFWDDRTELEDWEQEHAVSLAKDLGLNPSD